MPKPPTNATGRSGGAPRPSATVASSDHLDTRTAAHELLERLSREEEGPGTDWAVVLIGSFHHRAALGEALATVRAGFGARHALAMTATAVAAADPALEDAGAATDLDHPAGPGLAALAIPLSCGKATPIRLDIPDGPPEHWGDAEVLARFPGLREPRSTILLADPFTLAAGPLAERLDRARSPEAGTIFGALASGASIAGANALVLDGFAGSTGGVGLTLGPELRIDAVGALAAVGVGPEFVVTRGHGDRIEELSGIRAAEAMLGAIGHPADPDGPPPPLTMLGAAVDAAASRRGRGDWRLRTVTAIVRDGSITTDEPIRPGRTVRFHRLDAEADGNDLALLLDLEQLHDPPIAALAWCGTGRRPAEVASLLTRRLAAPSLAATSIGEILPIGGHVALQRRSIAVGLLRRNDPGP